MADIFAQVEVSKGLSQKVTNWNIDFNGFLRTAEGAQPVLQELDKHPKRRILRKARTISARISKVPVVVQEAVRKNGLSNTLMIVACTPAAAVDCRVGWGRNGDAAENQCAVRIRLTNRSGCRWSEQVLQPRMPCTSARFYPCATAGNHLL